MQKLTLIFLFSLSSFLSAFAQDNFSNYSFLHDSSEYRSLDLDYANIMVEIDSLEDNGMQLLGFGFDFHYAGQDFNQLSLFTDGEIHLSGPSTNPNQAFVISPLSTNLYDKFQDASGVDSKIRYALSGGLIGPKTLKIEYYRMGFTNGKVQDEVSFQVWLSEMDSSISFHYASTQLADIMDVYTPTYSPTIALLAIDWVSEDATGIYLDGEADNPQLVPQQGSYFPVGIDSPPDSGTIYKFCPAGCNLNATSIGKLDQHALHFLAYPNPAEDHLTLEFTLPNPQPYTIVLRSSTGQKLLKQHYPNPSGTQQSLAYNLSTLASGIYLLEVQLASGRMSKKVIVQ
ncbi:MAG: T9SS type A sorting domain-containing protein [Bacteroidota bacterium]